VGSKGAGAGAELERGRWLGVRLLAYGACGLGALGCSSAARESDKSPSDQCADYVSHYCAKAVDCAQSTDRSDLADTCTFSFRVYLPCTQVTALAGATQPCLDALDAIECSSIGPGSYPTTPSACQGLYIFQ
jgi:hypothetical protein